MPRILLSAAVTVILASALAPSPVLAWGHSGHVMVGRLAAEALPADLPAFLRTPEARFAIAEWNAEPDLSRTAGETHDKERDPGHFIDLDDEERALGVISLAAIPPTRVAYDTALRAAGKTQYEAGYLWHEIVGGWQQVMKDFAYIRVLSKGLETAEHGPDRAFFEKQLELRQQLTLRDIGVWGHYVADASQPMHVTVHYDGWGDHPNPNNYTKARIHAPFEGAYVTKHVSAEAVRAVLPAPRDCGCTIEQRVTQYLQTTLAQLPRTYDLAGPTRNYSAAAPAATLFIGERVGAGAGELRDLIVDAWHASASWKIGYPFIVVAEVEAGRIKVTPSSFWAD